MKELSFSFFKFCVYEWLTWMMWIILGNFTNYVERIYLRKSHLKVRCFSLCTANSFRKSRGKHLKSWWTFSYYHWITTTHLHTESTFPRVVSCKNSYNASEVKPIRFKLTRTRFTHKVKKNWSDQIRYIATLYNNIKAI